MKFKVKFLKQYEFKRIFRRPFNIFYDTLLLAGFISALLIFQKIFNAIKMEGSDADNGLFLEYFVPIFVSVLFVILFFTIWYAIISFIRKYHLDKNFYYINLKSVELGEFQLRIHSRKLTNFEHTKITEKTDYSNIKGLCILTVPRSNRRILEIKVSNIHKTRAVTDTGNTGSCINNPLHFYNEKENINNTILLLPLSMKKEDLFIEELLKRCRNVSSVDSRPFQRIQ